MSAAFTAPVALRLPRGHERAAAVCASSRSLGTGRRRQPVEARFRFDGPDTDVGGPTEHAVDPARVSTDRLENLRGFVKTRGSLDPDEHVVFWWTGDIYGLVEDEPNRHLFAFEGYNVGRCVPVDGGWRLLTREVGIYRDPVTREIIRNDWENPYTGEKNTIVHIWNDPVNQQFLVRRNPDGTPRPGGGIPTTRSGDDLYWHAEISLSYPSPLPASQFPTAARTDTYQSLEMFQFFCKAEDLASSEPSIGCQISWVRVGQWLPWMAMGDRPGRMVYHCRGRKLPNGYQDLDHSVRAFVEEDHPQYTRAPDNFSSPNETSWTYFKKLLAAKGMPRADGTVAIPEDTPLTSGDFEATSANRSAASSKQNVAAMNKEDTPMTLDYIAKFNGEDPSKPIYLSLAGRVFDVSTARRHYRKGETYNCLTGRDATCAFVSGDLSEEGLARGFPAMGDQLSGQKQKDLDHWVEFFAKTYPQVGVIVQ